MVLHNEDGRTMQSRAYSWKSASVTAAGTTAATDLSTVTGFTNLFAPFISADGRRRNPYKISVWASATLYLKINGGDVITVTSTAPFIAEDLVISSIFVSTNNQAVTTTVYLQ